jgi:hypothetical protein
MAHPRLPTPVDGDQRTSDVFERALFDSAHGDAVPELSRHRVALALGIGGPPNGAGNGGAAASELGGAPHGASTVTAGGAARGTLGGASQSLLVVVVAGGLAALAFLRGSEDAIAPTIAVSAPRQLAPPPSPAPPRPVVVAPAAVDTPAEPSALPAPKAPRSATTSRRASKPPAARAPATPARGAESRLLEEVALLDLARAALAASDAPLALERVRHYSAEFPGGVLADEARRLEARARSHAKGSNPLPTRH